VAAAAAADAGVSVNTDACTMVVGQPPPSTREIPLPRTEWELASRGRGNLELDAQTRSLNDRIETVQSTMERQTPCRRNSRQDDAEPHVALRDLTASFERLDEGIQGVQERSRLFGEIASLSPPPKKLSPEHAARSTSRARPNASYTERRCSGEPSPEVRKAGAFQAARLLNEEAVNTVDLDRRSSPNTGQLKLRAIAGGVSMRALQALAEVARTGENLHEKEEVCKISSSRERVETKLLYYRENEDSANPLVTAIEQDYMCVEAGTGALLVNVSRLRSTSSQGERGGGRPGCRGSSSMRTTTPRTPTPRLTSITPELKMRSVQDRALQNAVRAGKAAKAAREIGMDRRVEHLRCLMARQSRRDKADLARPWLMWAVVAMASVGLREIVEMFHSETEFSEGREAQLTKDGMIDDFRHEAMHRMNLAGMQVCVVLRPAQIRRIVSMVWARRLDHQEYRRRSSIWRTWMLLIRCVLFCIRIREPLRRHMLMDMVKDFIQRTWRGFLMRKTIHSSIMKMRFLQRSFRDCHRHMMIVRKRILRPQVWAVESVILGQAFGIADDVINEEVEFYMGTQDVEFWRKEAKKIENHRCLNLQESGALPPLFRLVGSRPGSGEPPRTGERLASWSGTTSGGRPVLVAAPPVGGGASFSPQQLRRPAARASAGLSLMFGLAAYPGVGTDSQQAAQSQHCVRQLTSVNSSLKPFAIVDKFRLSHEERDFIVLQVWRENLDRWWRAYRIYKASLRTYKSLWMEWVQEVSHLGDNSDLWPDAPQPLAFPEEIAKVHDVDLRVRVTQLLRNGGAASLL